MIHEIRTYTIIPGGIREYLRIYNESGREVQTRLLGNLVAFLVPETGNLNQLVYHWAFECFEDRAQRRAQLTADQEFTEFRKQVKHLLVKQEIQLLNPA